MSSEAFVTLATNDGYALGALVLGQSIRQVGTTRQLVVMISKHLSNLLRKTLQSTFDEVIVVPELDSQDAEHLRLLSRPELGVTFTKLHCWLLDQYSKCIFLDADCVVLKSIDDLFEREELSAAPDAGWPDCFNSGLFVYRPSKETHRKLMEFANQQSSSFDGGDQGLLNGFFSNWRSSDISRHIPFTYNVTSNAFYSYLPAVTQFRSDIRMVHFAGPIKPWQLTYNPQTQQLSGNLGSQHEIQRDFLRQWWQVMYEHVWPQLSTNSQHSDVNQVAGQQGGSQSQGGFGLVGAGSTLNYASLTSQPGVESGSAAHRRAWEAGHIDYTGRDSFSHIQQQLERNIAQQQQQYHPSQPRQPTPDRPVIGTNNEQQHEMPMQTASKQPTPPPASSTGLQNIGSSLGAALPSTNKDDSVSSAQTTSGAHVTGSSASGRHTTPPTTADAHHMKKP